MKAADLASSTAISDYATSIAMDAHGLRVFDRGIQSGSLTNEPSLLETNHLGNDSTTSNQSNERRINPGLGEPLPVSGIHGTGVAELLEVIEPHLYEVTEQQLADEELMGKNTVSVSLVGRPNVRKSKERNEKKKERLRATCLSIMDGWPFILFGIL